MGFQRKTYKLVFPEGHEQHGLVVRTKGLSVGELEVVSGMRESAQGASSFAQLGELTEIFARALIEWNYEDEDGVPIGTTLEEITKRGDFRDVVPVMLAWVEEVGNVPAPLPKSSNSGQPFPEELIPMDELSASPLS